MSSPRVSFDEYLNGYANTALATGDVIAGPDDGRGQRHNEAGGVLKTLGTHSHVFRWMLRLLALVAVAAASAILVWAFLSRNKPNLQPWHREPLAREWREAEMGPSLTLADYIAREPELFEEIKQRVEGQLDDTQRVLANRYFSGSPMNPANFTGPNWTLYGLRRISARTTGSGSA